MRPDIRALAAGGVLVLVLGAIVAATSNGVASFGTIDRPQGEQQQSVAERDPAGVRDQNGGSQSRGDSPRHPTVRAAPWLRSIALLMVAALAGAFLVVVGSSFRVLWRRRRPKGGRVPTEVTGTHSEIEPTPAEAPLEQVLEQKLASFGEGSPRNAIVAAWVALEEFVAAEGSAPHESDTPSEFVARSLTSYDLDKVALRRMADLYREARFSEHPVTESMRSEARGCLERLVTAVAVG